MHVGDRLASLRAGDFSVLEAPAATPAPH